jgi:hypothetical protein
MVSRLAIVRWLAVTASVAAFNSIVRAGGASAALSSTPLNSYAMRTVGVWLSIAVLLCAILKQSISVCVVGVSRLHADGRQPRTAAHLLDNIGAEAQQGHRCLHKHVRVLAWLSYCIAGELYVHLRS